MKSETRPESRSGGRPDAGAARIALVRNIPLLLAGSAVLVIVSAAGFLLAPGRSGADAAMPAPSCRQSWRKGRSVTPAMGASASGAASG